MARQTPAPQPAPQNPCVEKRRGPNRHKVNVDAVLGDQPIQPTNYGPEQLDGMLVHLGPPFIALRVGFCSWFRRLWAAPLAATGRASLASGIGITLVSLTRLSY